MNWTVDRDTPEYSAAADEKFQLTLSAGDFLKLRYSLLLVRSSAVAFWESWFIGTGRH